MGHIKIEDLDNRQLGKKELRLIRGGVAGSIPRWQYPAYTIPAPGGGDVSLVLVEGLVERYRLGTSYDPFNWNI